MNKASGNYLTNVSSISDETSIIRQLKSDSERAAYLEALLCAYVTNGVAEIAFYPELRQHFLRRIDTRVLVPRWIKTFRSMAAVWEHIRYQGKTSEERQNFIRTALRPLKEYLLSAAISTPELKSSPMSAAPIMADSAESSVWQKAQDEIWDNPDGAVTLAAMAFENNLEQQLTKLDFELGTGDYTLYDLYQELAKRLELYPSLQTTVSFASILDGVSEVVSGFDLLSSELGETTEARLSPGQAELTVRIARAISEFLSETVLSLDEI